MFQLTLKPLILSVSRYKFTMILHVKWNYLTELIDDDDDSEINTSVLKWNMTP